MWWRRLVRGRFTNCLSAHSIIIVCVNRASQDGYGIPDAHNAGAAQCRGACRAWHGEIHKPVTSARGGGYFEEQPRLRREARVVCNCGFQQYHRCSRASRQHDDGQQQGKLHHQPSYHLHGGLRGARAAIAAGTTVAMLSNAWHVGHVDRRVHLVGQTRVPPCWTGSSSRLCSPR